MFTARTASFVTRAMPRVIDPLALQQCNASRYPYLLQSVAHGTPQSRYDILFAFPGAQLRLNVDGSCVNEQGIVRGTDFLSALDTCWSDSRSETPLDADAPPFRGGWFLYLGYELANQIERGLKLASGNRLPVAWATRIPAAVVIDHRLATTTLVVESDRAELLDEMQSDLSRTDAHATKSLPPVTLASTLQEDDPEPYLDAVERARRYILDGDIFQANLSRRWRTSLDPDTAPLRVYQQLRKANPAPFAGLALHQDAAVISSSPERLVSVRNGRIDARPIAGTRPRHADAAADAALIRELIEHPKERAEHVMLLDLERNDLGRVARTGSVRVDELMVVESYSHVHHIVSNVCAELRPDATPGQVIRAVFPGGTITGCPKVRCMEIISELEQTPREAYTGSMGYLNRDGDMDLNILIRTLIQDGTRLEFRAGAGIVADSIPERELDETRAKARGMARALGVAY
ncbi:MAG TPA: aminodeoxychorismate synthase component I [Gammaproteobacteria bacterium]|nr:aminodeoxychorismate synthase component I [Gammaproteobacteria bacterium]